MFNSDHDNNKILNAYYYVFNIQYLILFSIWGVFVFLKNVIKQKADVSQVNKWHMK